MVCFVSIIMVIMLWFINVFIKFEVSYRGVEFDDIIDDFMFRNMREDVV